MTVTEHIREHLLQSAGVVDKHCCAPPLDDLIRSEMNRNFLRLMTNRVVMGFFRYGSIHNPSGVDYIANMHKRLNMYSKTGNAEMLVDVANLCMAEFTQKNHPNFHFEATDDEGHAT